MYYYILLKFDVGNGYRKYNFIIGLSNKKNSWYIFSNILIILNVC